MFFDLYGEQIRGSVRLIDILKGISNTLNIPLEDIKNALNSIEENNTELNYEVSIRMQFNAEDEIYISDYDINEIDNLKSENEDLKSEIVYLKENTNIDNLIQKLSYWYYDENGRNFLESNNKDLQNVTNLIKNCIS